MPQLSKNGAQVNTIRSFLASNVDILLETVSQLKSLATADTSSDDLFGDGDIVEKKKQIEWRIQFETRSLFEVLISEKNSLGLYVSGNPLSAYLPLSHAVTEMLGREDLRLVIIDKIRKIFTRSNVMMFALQITVAGAETEYEGIVFPKRAPFLSSKLQEKQIMWVRGNILDGKKRDARAKQVAEGADSEEYEELPKIAFDDVCLLTENPLNMYEGDEVSIAMNRKTLLNAVPWDKLATNPAALESTQTSIVDTPTQLLVDPIQIRVPNSVAQDILSTIKRLLHTESSPGLEAIELSIQVGEEWKKVKTAFWGDVAQIEELLRL